MVLHERPLNAALIGLVGSSILTLILNSSRSMPSRSHVHTRSHRQSSSLLATSGPFCTTHVQKSERLRLPGPTFGRAPGTTIRSYLVGSPWRQHFVGPRPDVDIELRDLFLVEQLGPGLHRAVVAPVLNNPQKLLERQFFVRIGQIRRQRRP